MGEQERGKGMKPLFIPCSFKRSPIPAVKKVLRRLENYKRIGLLTTAQHMNQLEDIKKFLESNRKKTVIGGQVLGCNQDSAIAIDDDIDAFLYVGSGKFHPLGISLATEKPVFIANPYSDSTDEISDGDKKRFLRKRKGRISRALTAGIFGVLISTKTGQFRLKSALKIKEMIEGFGRKAILFTGNEISPGNVIGYKVDAWINTACPRINDDEFNKPVLNPEDLEIIF